MNKDSKIYVAGHAGLVGSAIVRQLQAQGYANLVMKTHAELDLTQQTAVTNFFQQERPEYVFLAAAKVGGIMANNTYRAEFIYENLQIQNNVIHASYQSGVSKLLFLGSSCIYPKNAAQPLSEDCLLTGELEYTNEPYALAKIAGIKLCESYNLQYGTNYIAVMPTNLYGIKDNFDLDKSHVLPALLRKFYLAKLLGEQNYHQLALNLKMANQPAVIKATLAAHGIDLNSGEVQVTLWGSGTPFREFLFVDDMADACIYVMQQLDFTDLVTNHKEVRNSQLNIGSASDLSIKELAELIAKTVGYNGRINFDATKPDGTRRKLLDVSKLTALGWKATTSLEEGVKKVFVWYLQQLE